MRAGARKQAFVPVRRRGARAGRHRAGAAGAVARGRWSRCCPGRRASCRRCGTAAVDDRRRCASCWRRAGTLEQRILRFFPLPEPQIAATLRELDADALPLEITTCLRRGELEVATVFDAGAAAALRRASRRRCASATATCCSPTTGRRSTRSSRGCSPGRTIATAESCTGGLMAGRLTDLAGSSAYVLGGLVVYSNEAKTALAGVPAALIEAHGAVSPEVATRAGRRARARASAPTSASASPASPAPAAAARRSRSAPSACASPARRRRRGAHRPPPGRPRRRPRPHDHGRAAHAARAAAHERRASTCALVAGARLEGVPGTATRCARRSGSSSRSTSRDVRDALAALGDAADPDVWRAVAPRGAARHARVPRRPPAGGRRRDRRRSSARRARRRRALALGDVLLLPPRRARVLTVALDDPTATLGRAAGARRRRRSPPPGVYTPETRAVPPARHGRPAARRARPPARASMLPRSSRSTFSARPRVTLYRSQLRPRGRPLRAARQRARWPHA